jgi:hypothetical protein
MCLYSVGCSAKSGSRSLKAVSYKKNPKHTSAHTAHIILRHLDTVDKHIRSSRQTSNSRHLVLQNSKSIKTRKMLKHAAKVIRRAPSKAKILEVDDDSTSTIDMKHDSISSFDISRLPSSVHWRSLQDKPKKSVSFGDITIREHAMIIGDSVPGCGVPITIDWEAQSEVVLKVEDYEEHRPERRRGGPAMYMSPRVRLTLAIDSGRTMREIRTLVSECERIRKERIRSLPSRKWRRISKVMRTKLSFKKNVSSARSA